MRRSFLASDRTYGARRVWRDVLEEGFSCGLHRIERLMRDQALRARPRRRGLPPDTGERQAAAIAPNVLDRIFEAPAVDPVLLKWVARGWVWWKEIRTGKASLHDIAERERVSARFISMHLELAFMAPDVIASVVDGRHPSFMNAQALRTMRLPPTWAEQREVIVAREVAGRR